MREDWFTVSKTDPIVRQVIKAAFPDYKGRTIKIAPQHGPLDTTSYWDGGTRSYYCAVELKTMRTMTVPQNGTPWDGGPIAPNGVMIPVGFAIVENCIFCGKDLGLRIHIHPDSLPKMLTGSN